MGQLSQCGVPPRLRRGPRLGAPLLVLAVAGCSIEAAGLREVERPDAGASSDGGIDARGEDAGAARDASRDAARADAALDGAADASPDADAGPPDAGASCDEIFGTAPEHIPCWETPTTCAFNVDTGGESCGTVCERFGRACVEAYDNPNDPGDECDVNEADGCGHTGRSTELCECAR